MRGAEAAAEAESREPEGDASLQSKEVGTLSRETARCGSGKSASGSRCKIVKWKVYRCGGFEIARF